VVELITTNKIDIKAGGQVKPKALIIDEVDVFFDKNFYG